jgi:proline dehydrogenase
MIRSAIHRIAQQAAGGPAILRSPLSPLLERFSGGERIDVMLSTVRELTDSGLLISLERATPMTAPASDQEAVLDDLMAAISGIAAMGLGPVSEIDIFGHTFGLTSVQDVDPVISRLAPLIDYAQSHGVSVMFGAGSRESTDAHMRIVRELRDAGHVVGITLQASLRRTERDCAAMADGPIRLVKGGYHVHGGEVFTSAAEVDKSFIRCAKVLLQSPEAISFATHDDRLITIVESLLERHDRQQVEFAFYLARHESLQQRLLHEGWPVRVYVPFGPEWFTRLVDGFAERPSSLASAVRAIVTGE